MKDIRIRQDLTLEQVGKRIGRTKKSVQLYEQGDVTISVSILRKIVEGVYGIRLGTFLNNVFAPNKGD